MWNIFKKSEPVVEPKTRKRQKIEEPDVAVAPKVRKKRQPKVHEEPNVEIKKIVFDYNNPAIGSFELDWNHEFISMLKNNGYHGSTEEEIVNRWFTELCKTVASEEIKNLPDIPSMSLARKEIGNGRTEIS
jgi:hypothetical protein